MKKPEKGKKKSRSYSRQCLVIPAFLYKTYEILENPDYKDIISWNDDGNAFIVKRVNEFSDQILPKYFKHNNFASFVRQLNMYDFHKTRQESSENEFKHKLFRRGYKNLLCQIKRKTSENQQSLSLVPISQRVVDLKSKKDNQFLMEEMITLRNKQEDLEKVCSILLSQNNKLLNENKMLWEQVIKTKSKNERKLEKFLLKSVKSIMNDKDDSDQGQQSDGLLQIEDVKLDTENHFQNDNKLPESRLVKRNSKLRKENMLNEVLKIIMSLRKSNNNYLLKNKRGKGRIPDEDDEDDEDPIDLIELSKKCKLSNNQNLIMKDLQQKCNNRYKNDQTLQQVQQYEQTIQQNPQLWNQQYVPNQDCYLPLSQLPVETDFGFPQHSGYGNEISQYNHYETPIGLPLENGAAEMFSWSENHHEENQRALYRNNISDEFDFYNCNQ